MNLEEAIAKCPEIYQDIIVDGELIKQGRRLCRNRAEMILDVVEDKDSVLDIGANFAYFGHRILSEKKQCTYLGIEREITSCTIAANVLNPYSGAVYVCGNFTYPLLKAIDSTCENVDTLLLMSIIHHFPEEHLVEMCIMFDRLCRKLVIELAPSSDKNACGQEVINNIFGRFNNDLDALSVLFPNKEFKLVGTAKSHVTNIERPVYVGIQKGGIGKYEKVARDPYVGKIHNERNYLIKDRKMLKQNVINDSTEMVNLNHGFLLWNWASLGPFVAPSREAVTEQAEQRFEQLSKESTDIRPWNLLWTSRGIRYIDISSSNEPEHCQYREDDIVPVVAWLNSIWYDLT